VDYNGREPCPMERKGKDHPADFTGEKRGDSPRAGGENPILTTLPVQRCRGERRSEDLSES